MLVLCNNCAESFDRGKTGTSLIVDLFGLQLLQDFLRGSHQLRIIAHPLNGPADGRTVLIKPARDLAAGNRQLPAGQIADQPAGLRNLYPPGRSGQFFRVDSQIPTDGGNHLL